MNTVNGPVFIFRKRKFVLKIHTDNQNTNIIRNNITFSLRLFSNSQNKPGLKLQAKRVFPVVALAHNSPSSTGGSVANLLQHGGSEAHPVRRYLPRMRTAIFLFPVQRSQATVFGSGLLHKETKRLQKWFVNPPNMCLHVYLRHTFDATWC